MSAKNSAPDWPAIKSDYLRGTESLREIGENHSVSDTAIRKRAKAEGWPPRAKQVRKAANCEPAVRTAPADPEEAKKRAEPGAIADAGRGLVRRMLDELDVVTTHVGELEEMIEVETADDRNSKRRDAMLGAISLGGRAKTLKELATAFKTINEASAPAQGKKAQQQDAARDVAASARFRPVGKPALAIVKP